MNSSEIHEVCQILAKILSIVLLPLLQAFSSSSGLYKVILRKLNRRRIIYFDEMLLVAFSLEDLLMARDTLIFILQHLGFLINIKKSYLETPSTLELLGVIVDSGEMTRAFL